MNELPNANIIIQLEHSQSYKNHFFRNNIQSSVMKSGGLYVFCDYIGEEKLFSFYGFSGKDFRKIPKGYNQISLSASTSKIWQIISGNIMDTHGANQFCTDSLEYLVLPKEKEDRWSVYLRNETSI